MGQLSDSAPPTQEARGGGARPGTVLVAAVLVGLVAVLAVAPAAALTASRLPEPWAVTPLALPPDDLAATTGIRTVPVGLAAGTAVGSVAEVRPQAVAALGSGVADRLLAFLAAPAEGLDWPSVGEVTTDYPYRFSAVDEVLDTVDEARLADGGAALGAALFLLAAQPQVPHGLEENAVRLAFAVLDRARATGGCDAQLNLLALVASDAEVPSDVVGAETSTAERACPGDPTPGWLAVQYDLNIGLGVPEETTVAELYVELLAAAEERATELVRDFPTDPGVLATLGDVHLATGRNLAAAQPFTSRRAFRDADAVFARLLDADEGVTARLGAARAHLGLGRAAEAARLATAAADGSQHPARALQVAVAAQERARDFAAASGLARRLADLGTGAFPEPTALIPLDPPRSLGSELLTPVRISLLGSGQGGGGTVGDEGFVPPYRDAPDLTDAAPSCPEWVWRRDALLAGDAASAAAGWPEEFDDIDSSVAGQACPDGTRLKQQVDNELAGGLPSELVTSEAPEEVEALLDDRQNLLRWAGDLTAAREGALRWAEHLGGDTALAHQRLGEIAYLAGEYDVAAAHFSDAAWRWRVLSWGNDLAAGQALLGRGAALLRAGRAGEAVPVLRPLVLEGAKGYGYQSTFSDGFENAHEFARLSYFASALLGDHELAGGLDRAAAEDFAAALSWSDSLEAEVRLDAVRNSAAIAALGTGDTTGALELSRAALAADPMSPVYLMTAADVAQRGGDDETAVRQNREALESDPTNYPAANNLGVLLARRGHLEEASRVLRAAVAAEPAYALGWHNLGVVEGRRGAVHVIASQGALAEAASLDPGYGDRPPRTALDTTTYRTSLDVSKPLPEGWSFAQSQRTAPAATVGLLAMAIAGVGLVSLRGGVLPSGAKDWLEGVGSRLGRLRGIGRLRRPQWAVVATVAAFLLAFWREWLWPWTGLAYAVALASLVGVAMVARGVVARRRSAASPRSPESTEPTEPTEPTASPGVVHATWPPGVLVGLVAGAIGSPLAPMPVVRAPANEPRVAMAAPLVLAGLSLVLLLEAALWRTPLTASLCVAAFVMAGSLLLPVQPLDGARAGRAGVVGAVGILGAVLLLGLGLV